MAEFDLGQVAFVDRGVYSPAATYKMWDFITTIDSMYLYINNIPAIATDILDTDYWKCIADGKPATQAANLANEKAGIANQAAIDADNARLAIQTDLGLKEATANKQNSLTADGTGTKFPTVDAVNGNFASQSEAESNTENTKFMTALRVFQNWSKKHKYLCKFNVKYNV